jgi:diaminohydroxyphosphoribosylaminopyrimidine deaminase / 5-amino-6-(5-phosphoribosylamino)uracil reductase
MRRALELAERGWGRVAPNPLVGAVIVRDGKVVGEGWHTEYGKAHAEVEAIRAAGEAARGATMYVTLEPCSHRGKTGPCTDAVVAAGIARLVFAAADPNPKASGGATTLRQRGVAVDGGVEEARASRLNAAFLHAHAAGPRRPWIELKLAISIDGRIADAGRRSRWLTGPRARDEVHRLRAGHDAVAVGIGTALADDPLLTARGATQPRIPPVRVVFDRHLRLPLDSRLVQTLGEAPLWILCAPEPPEEKRLALESRGVTVIGAVDTESALAELKERGIRSLFCEGGAGLASGLLEADVVHRLTLFVAPVLLGAEAPSGFGALSSPTLADARRWALVRSEAIEGDSVLVFDR